MTHLRLNEYDQQGNPRESRAADTVFRVAVIFGILLTIAYIVELALLIVFPSGTVALNTLAWELSPGYSTALLFLSVILGLIVNPVGIVGLLRGTKCLVQSHFWSSFFLVLVNLFVFIYLLMRGNGVVVVGSQNIDSNNLADPTVRIDTFSDVVQKQIVRFALDNPEEWLQLQLSSGDSQGCCGLNMRSVYGNEVFDIDDFDLDVLLSNEVRCIAGRAEMDALLLEFPQFDDEVLERASDSVILSSSNFFCDRILATEIKSKAQGFSVLFGVQVFVQVIVMFLAGSLLYSYQEKDGGFKPNEESLDARPKVENTVLVNAGYNPQSSSMPTRTPRSAADKNQGAQRVQF